MATVYLCSPTNSTFFTTCCNVAICDHEALCPHCEVEVTPLGHASRWAHAYQPVASGLRTYGSDG